MSRVLIILMFVYGLLLASAGVGICIHAAGSDAIQSAHFVPYMVTGWVCLGVGLVLSLGSIKSAQRRERMLARAGEAPDVPANHTETPSVSFPQRAACD